MIGVSSPAFCQAPFQEMLGRISEHFGLWEVLSEGEDMLSKVAGDIVYGRTSIGMRFQVHAPMSDVNIGSVYEPMRKASVGEISGIIALCRRLEIPTVTVHPGFVNGLAFLDRSQAFIKTKESLREIDVIARENSVTVAVENMPAHINATCTTAAELFEAVEGTGLGICFDMGHANTSGQTAHLLSGVSSFRNVHLHNNDGSFDQHNRVDEGTADLSGVLRAIKGSYAGNLIIESTDLASGAESKKVLERMLG